ncbi:helix-turn-helix domain-containing protein [Hymenobacter coccineus]|uniref:AraC family transcriptional regulator n=1 Tax=Hymenobacter coccineus TaxID=1908235 RepID=A0A1G1TGQ0_9BACT|nr:AraC family transcriptional regulator [Hymenobacter coccineus]OGX90038.1 AraC family transcriptional regulator [Hymenobacter coccineus]
MKHPGSRLYQTLHEQYQDLGWPVALMAAQPDFTVFNLADLHQPLPFTAPLSRLNFFVFVFVKSARGRYVVDEQQFSLWPGTVYFTNPGHFRAFEYQALEEVYLVTLSEDFLRAHVHPAVFEEFPFLLAETFPALTVPPAVFAEFERLYLQLHREYVSRSPFRQRLMGHLLLALLLKLNEHFGLDYSPIYEGNRSSDIVRGFKRLLEQHYRDLAAGRAEQAFRVQDYADAQQLHPNYLSTVIKVKTGRTIGTWIADKNIAEAKALLQSSSVAVKEIAYRLGFAEPAHFSTYFKKHTLVSPLRYRKENQGLAS